MHQRLGDGAVNKYQSGFAFINWHALTPGVFAACWPTNAQMEFLSVAQCLSQMGEN